MHEHVQPAARGDAGVLLAQRAGRGVARVGVGRLPRRDELGVELLERLDGEEHLTADLDPGRVVAALELVRDALDRLDVVGHVLPRAPVAAGERAGEPALLVEEVHGQPVDLQLAQIVVCRGAGVAGHPRRPGGELLGREAVVETEHPLEVVDGGEVGGEDRATHLLRGALGSAQLGIGLLELAQPPDQLVVLAVADGRRVLDVVGELRRAGLLGEVDPLVARLLRSRTGDEGVGCRRSRALVTHGPHPALAP